MAGITGQGTTFNLPNYVGELFNLSHTDTPLLSMAGGLSGGKSVSSKVHTWQTYDLATAANPNILEGADAPSRTERVRAEVSNILSIFHYAVEVSYTKQAATAQLGASASPVLGDQPVSDEFQWQIEQHVKQAARDVNYAFWNSTYAAPADNLTSRQMRGLREAVSTNAVTADSGGGSPDALTKAYVDTLLRTMHGNDAPFSMPVIFCGLFQAQQISSIYGLNLQLMPRDRNVGGVNIRSIETEVGNFGIVVERDLPATELYVVDMSVVAPVFMPIPGKGHFFLEPLAKTGSADDAQLYGEIGIEYGPETWHGKITNLTSA